MGNGNDPDCIGLGNRLKNRAREQALNRPSLFLLFFVQGVSSYAANPDLISAPIPVLSQTAWQELERQSSMPTTVTLHAQITASKCFVSAVTIREANQWPISEMMSHGSNESEAWTSRGPR